MPWPALRKVSFRWLFSYLLLYCLQLSNIWPFTQLIPRVGEILGMTVQLPMNSSGDTPYHYISALCFAGIAGVVALVWSILDRTRSNDHRLYLALRVLVRLWLGAILIRYGTMKVIPSQFGELALHRLIQPFGDASPMGLLWTFMGASAPYTAFTGTVEMFAGVLLFFPQTATLGALIAFGALSHIVALNLCYDGPAKLLSSHLLFLAFFLAAPDLRRLANLFIFNQPVEPARRETVLQRPAYLRAAAALKVVFLVAVTGVSLFQSYASRARISDPKPELYGIWQAEHFAFVGEAGTPEPPAGEHWQRLIVGGPAMLAFVQRIDGQRIGFQMNIDSTAKKLRLGNNAFRYSTPSHDVLHLEGRYEGRNLRATLRLVDENSFLLKTRGFHWVSESPFNR